MVPMPTRLVSVAIQNQDILLLPKLQALSRLIRSLSALFLEKETQNIDPKRFDLSCGDIDTERRSSFFS